MPASENQGLNQASSLCGLDLFIGPCCFRVLHSHCVRGRALTAPQEDREAPQAGLNLCPPGPAHTSSLAAGVGSRGGPADAGGCPMCLIAVIACLVFCICLHVPRQWQPPTQSLSESLSLSSSHTHVFMHTHKYTWPQSQLGPLPVVYSQGKNSHRRTPGPV